jgi:hypothetical protein
MMAIGKPADWVWMRNAVLFGETSVLKIACEALERTDILVTTWFPTTRKFPLMTVSPKKWNLEMGFSMLNPKLPVFRSRTINAVLREAAATDVDNPVDIVDVRPVTAVL